MLSQGSDEDIGALGIALELGSLYEDLTQAVSNWLRNVGTTTAMATTTVTFGVSHGDPSAPSAAAGRGASGSGTIPSVAADHGAGAARGRAAQQQQRRQQQVEADLRQQREAEAEYVRAVRPLQFTEVPILQGHYFR